MRTSIARAACALLVAADVQLFAVPTAGAGLSNIVAGPDGALWFNEQDGFAVGRITTAGAVTEIPVPRASYSANGDGPTPRAHSRCPNGHPHYAESYVRYGTERDN